MTVKDVMSRDVVTVTPDTSLKDVAAQARRARRLWDGGRRRRRFGRRRDLRGRSWDLWAYVPSG
jgi:CBS domain-containing protein